MDLLLDHDGLMGWSAALSHPVMTITVAGDHHSFLREPRVGQLTAAIEGFLGGSGSSTSGRSCSGG